jgi:hypothetical protein
MGNSNSLFASLIWGSVGLGLAVYGKRQQSPVPLVGGIVLITLSYFIGSALWLTLVGAALTALTIWLARRLG